MIFIEHIPNPYHGWFLCGHIPRHVDGVMLRGPEILDTDEIRTCKTCERIRRQHKISRAAIMQSQGDLLGAADVDSVRLQEA